MGFYLGGLVIGRIFAPEIWGAYFWEGLLFFFFGRGGGGGGGLLSEFYSIEEHMLWINIILSWFSFCFVPVRSANA